MRGKSTGQTVTLTDDAIARFGRKEKALGLAAAGQATKLTDLSVGQRRVYLVTGQEQPRYRVTLFAYAEPWSAMCTCKARGLCSHMIAAKAVEETTDHRQAVVA